MSGPFLVPGVYRDRASSPQPREFATGVPVFLGYASDGPAATAGDGDGDGDGGPTVDWSSTAVKLTAWSDFAERCGAPRDDGFLASAVRGFFENDGQLCYVLRLDDSVEFARGVSAALGVLKATTVVDLVCVPDAARRDADAIAVQQQVLEAIEADHRMAILDALPGQRLDETVMQWQQLSGSSGRRNGAIYYPWIVVRQGDGTTRAVPPCGHVAGVFARTDRNLGVFKPPANEVLEGVVDLERNVTTSDQRDVDPHQVVNCLRAFPGRGIRIWGARTTSGEADWRYISVRRLFLTTARWLEQQMADVVMEPNGPWLWARIRREVNAYLFKLFRRGALQGATPQEAYFVKCDAETTPAETRERGEVCVFVGLAAVVPGEFIVVRFVHGPGGVQIASSGDVPV